MRISNIKLECEMDGIKEFTMRSLGNVVVLTGSNGSGKSRILKLLERYFSLKQNHIENDITKLMSIEVRNNENQVVDISNGHSIKIYNYSHYDAPLQTPDKFSPYVISKAKSNLIKCNFEETALNALLFVQDLAKGYSADDGSGADFDDFSRFIMDLFELKLFRDADNNPVLFNLKISDAKLSPGQQYLLRMSVALYCNKLTDEEFILFLDEPETHLHPKVLWNLIENLQSKFENGQIWIATHSIALLSMFDSSAIYHLEKGQVKKLGSRSAPIIEGLVGDEPKRFKLQQFIVAPDAYACNEFAAECLIPPPTMPYEVNDPQIEMACDSLEGSKHTVVDFGAGQGRFLEGLGTDYPDILSNCIYYAYDKYDNYARECISMMEKYDVPVNNYFNDEDSLSSVLSANGKADHVFMINVIHEIPPIKWTDTFRCASDYLKETGSLIIVENEELTYGERPYDNGFMVPVEPALKIIENNGLVVECERHSHRKSIVKYVIPKSLLNIDNGTVKAMLEEIRKYSLNKIKEIKGSQKNENEKNAFKHGIQLAFWTHQYANVSLNLDEQFYTCEENHD